MKKSIKSILAAGLIAAMAASMSACGASNESSTAASADKAADTAAEATASADDIGFAKDETITLVVPGKAGGGSDLGIRYYSEGLNRIYGLKTTVTNYDSNTIGHQTVASAKPDGTTLTVATSALNIQYITGNAEVNPMKDFTVIACLQDNGFSTLAVPADAPYDDFAGFVDYAKAHPGELNAGMPAAGANTILFGVITKATGIELNSVECASESDRLTNLAGGFIDIGVVGVGNAVEYEKAGKIKVIGTVSSDGTTISEYPETLPDNYKTLQEQGFDDCYLAVFHYLLGPAGMDETMVKNMNAAMQAVCEDSTVSDGIASVGNIPGWHDLEESQKIQEEEYAQDVEISKDLGLFVQE
ncbi:tripartite tricarboxylate transporter substrate binding protein [Anaerobium acetethylicum]|uniref:Tripartite-type tricarboxylate transporter, receptor component TctC n=1 Tax=Anaerobium acetethylicum TaxID=1619234 RepID=A0A1D3TX68_9FIRM|nr:tripartite tricarboxylate transporter substrate binding protein [Anaerobium acetethylicum]SCP98891.1 Tripartite-type tricarboxylate transporter, receptor component TctC [Anaerobium acetethylicum]